MKTLLWCLTAIAGFLALYILFIVTKPQKLHVEGFELQTMEATDTAPSTSEVKNHYKILLLYCDADFRGSGVKSMRLIGDMRDRLFGHRDLRKNLKVDDILANWPAWIPPLDTSTKEPTPTNEDAVNAELRILSYLQANFPQEPGVDSSMGSTVMNIINDFGYRFVFIKGVETLSLRDDFLKMPLTRNWTNPTANV